MDMSRKRKKNDTGIWIAACAIILIFLLVIWLTVAGL